MSPVARPCTIFATYAAAPALARPNPAAIPAPPTNIFFTMLPKLSWAIGELRPPTSYLRPYCLAAQFARKGFVWGTRPDCRDARGTNETRVVDLT